MSTEISSRRPTGSNVSPRGPRRRSPKHVSSIFQSARSNRPGELRNRSLSVETWASVCVAADLADSPSQLPVASFRRGKPFLAGLPFDWTLSLASWNKIYYVFRVHLISWSWRTWFYFSRSYLHGRMFFRFYETPWQPFCTSHISFQCLNHWSRNNLKNYPDINYPNGCLFAL